ncbi:PREDICTED: serine carboxypeptidase-like 18 isoform X2 [Tarenaya hassleriana]|uniref:serine carboxypeptidase-like 18 isoform X2 n=1 Tax=Tarenaya hassleriana TaxID=28532 RepID=UPI0008FCEDE5|nr:PREDICTED: serine carboxypeptidase-like 18 isoform X2 [Tarenaya hassleriana]XP_010555476.2 PREDICTED: serine carboxypeptidase-like 18 isoform X2 [Tarenaya hassleriana]
MDEDYNGGVPSLVATTYSWTKAANIFYLDQPVGTGFSYARTPLAEKPSDTRQAEQVSDFVRKWLVDHLEFLSNPFYVTGDSYAGLVVPGIVQQISKGNEQGSKPRVNLQGYALGNPATDARFDGNYHTQYAHGMGLISDELYESLKRSCGENYISPGNSECINLLQDYDKCVSRLFDEFILIPNCEISLRTFPPQRRYLRGAVDGNLSVPGLDCYERRRSLIYYWANDESVHRALHVTNVYEQ